ncbi:MAG TPA: HAD-IA family hydrolase [Candidatus Limnocylindria bacterium]|nr:HAD-IA family hydrolase [Candidatus Limnocylindria bacterium]
MPRRIEAVLFDLLMAVMDSPAVWALAAGDAERGMAWRDAVTARMVRSGRYRPYEELVASEARALHLPPSSVDRLWSAWRVMDPRPDADAIGRLALPYAFVTNCSTILAAEAARRSGLDPSFVLSAEEAGVFKPSPGIYLMACSGIRSAPERTLFVAGAAYDAAGARAAGLSAALVVRRPLRDALDGRIERLRGLDEVHRVIR